MITYAAAAAEPSGQRDSLACPPLRSAGTMQPTSARCPAESGGSDTRAEKAATKGAADESLVDRDHLAGLLFATARGAATGPTARRRPARLSFVTAGHEAEPLLEPRAAWTAAATESSAGKRIDQASGGRSVAPAADMESETAAAAMAAAASAATTVAPSPAGKAALPASAKPRMTPAQLGREPPASEALTNDSAASGCEKERFAALPAAEPGGKAVPVASNSSEGGTLIGQRKAINPVLSATAAPPTSHSMSTAMESASDSPVMVLHSWYSDRSDSGPWMLADPAGPNSATGRSIALPAGVSPGGAG
mmetsp:Transcript_5650/g.23952  ORF Transcript_5650/g.23952 Transcript_5650/m.23952 type:complete len:308 (+) Transcript_5650:2459-3382(+)